MKFRKMLAFGLIVLGILGLFTGCGASSAPAPMENAAEAPMAQDLEGGMEGAMDAGMDTELTLPENRKWIVTVNLETETEDLDALLKNTLEQVTALEGYVENQEIYNGSVYSDYRYRSASLVLRIPADRVEEFSKALAETSNVVSQSRQVEDVTLQYVDTESRLAALRTEEARLLELMENAETMSDLLEIEGRLGDVRYELESAESRKRTFDNHIDYATVYLRVEEVREYTPVEEPTVWERISGGFMDNLRGLGEGLVDFVVWFLAGLPLLVPLAGVIWLVIWLVRRHRRKHPKMPKAK